MREGEEKEKEKEGYFLTQVDQLWGCVFVCLFVVTDESWKKTDWPLSASLPLVSRPWVTPCPQRLPEQRMLNVSDKHEQPVTAPSGNI